MKSRGQSITDRLLAARYTLTGQDVAKSVCKATTAQPMAPKKKHLDYLTYCSHRPNVQIAELANVLLRRAHSSSWIVVFKTLITAHYILIHGSERFLHYLASSTNTFEMDQFLDRDGAYGFAMSPYIKRYAKYLNSKVCAYRSVVYDFCKVQCGKDATKFSMMSDETLLDTLMLVQEVLDALLHFDCSVNDLNNGIIVTAINLLFRDLIRLFIFYNEGMINLLRRYFDMKKKQCGDALTLYKNFLTRLERIPGFVKVCETAGVNCEGVCDLRHAPDSLLVALEQHLASLKAADAQNTTVVHLWQAANRVSTYHLSPCSFPPHLGNGLRKVTLDEPECNITLATPQKLDCIYDDPIKLIRNPFVSVELLAAKPALSPADFCNNYAPAIKPSYVPPTFVSDRDFAAAFPQAQVFNTAHVIRNVNDVPNIRQENFRTVERNFSFDRRESIADSRASFLRHTSGWWPQQLASKNDPSYLPMRASTSNQTAAAYTPVITATELKM